METFTLYISNDLVITPLFNTAGEDAITAPEELIRFKADNKPQKCVKGTPHKPCGHKLES